MQQGAATMPTPRFLTSALLGLAIPAFCAIAPAAAQKAGDDAAKKKLYCWDQNGTRMCSDTLPQDAVNRARDEINAANGNRTAEVQRALTDEERAQQALDAAQQQADTAAADTRRRTEQAMLTSYQSEDELRRVFTDRAAMLDNNVRTARYNVASLRAGLAGQLGSAGDQELAGRKVPDKLRDGIVKQHADLLRQLHLQQVFEQQRAALDGEIQDAVQRYRTLVAPAGNASPSGTLPPSGG